MKQQPLLISVIIPSFNSIRFIGQTLENLMSQNYPAIEIIVIDGASTDGTVEYLKTLPPEVRWISEKDDGQSDALNKGFRMAQGEILGWLNADDLYAPHALAAVGEFFSRNPEIQWAFGPCGIIDDQGKEIRKLISVYKERKLRRYSYRRLLEENFISQMGVFFRRQALQAVGEIDVNLHYAMDYDLWLRLGARWMPGLISRRLAFFRMYQGTKSIEGFTKQFQEDFQVASRYTRNRRLLGIHAINNFLITTIYRGMAKFKVN